MNQTLITLALSIFLTQGEAALARALTPPEAWVKTVCKRTGADPAAALEERDEAAQAWVAFIAQLANVDGGVAAALDVENLGPASKLPNMNTNLVSLALTIYRAFGASMVTRMLTVPQSVVQKICDKSGADFQEVLASRNHATAELVEFIESLVDSDFVDPD